jgi:hypothetical protein
MSRQRIAIAAIAVLVTISVGWALVGSVKGTDPRLGACAGPVSNVRVAFDLAHARDLWAHIPGFLGAPELEIDKPAHVVVYDRPLQIDGPGRPQLPNGSSGPRTASNVVCVEIAGETTYYTSVDLSVVTP